MKDQVESIKSKGIQAAAMIKDAIQLIKNGAVDVIFASPEVLKGNTLGMLRDLSSQICLLVFDECHCISEWGLDFSPEYRKVTTLVSVFSDCPCLLLTATATPKIQNDLYNVLSLFDNTKVVALLPDRNAGIRFQSFRLHKLGIPKCDGLMDEHTRLLDLLSPLAMQTNVFLHVQAKYKENIEDNLKWLLEMVSDKQETMPKTIIYCRNLRNSEELYMWLMEELGERAYHYGNENYNSRFIEMFHSRTDEDTAERILSTYKLASSHIRVLCPTVAFGMGIYIPDVGIIINWGLPQSVMTFWQEVGRCGRDGMDGLRSHIPSPDLSIYTLKKNCLRVKSAIGKPY